MGAESGTIPAGPLLLTAFLLVALMGFAIQRGSTCLVAAMDEVVTHRTARRLWAILLAGLLAGALTSFAMPGYGLGPVVPPLAVTFAGAILLGAGALVNRACVVGTVARIGSGEWAFLFTPLGLFAGFLALSAGPWVPPTAGHVHSPAAAGPVSALLLAALLLPLLVRYLHPRAAWSVAPVSLNHPHVATAGIGLLFGSLAILASPWSYADALSHLARTGMADRPLIHLALIATLLASARLGGLAQAQARPRQCLVHCLRCFAGGALMAVGAALVPGSNDSLLLESGPRLQAHALLALPVMACTIALGLLLRRRFRL